MPTKRHTPEQIIRKLREAEVDLAKVLTTVVTVAVLGMLLTAQAATARDAEAVAKQAQNPVSDLISIPIEENFNVGGLHGETQHVINLLPVYPLKLNEDWLLINRAIMPLIYLPSILTGGDDLFGLGDINFTTFLSPRKSGANFFWGVGPSVSFPSATDELLGSGKYSLGPSAVVLTEQGPWVTGFLLTNIWSVGGSDRREDVSAGLLQPWLYYNFPSGAYVFTEPVITVNWKAESNERWTVPLGLGAGMVFPIGGQYINLQIAAFYNVVKPTGTADWTIRPQIQILFPN
jgi:hypothetical protein